MTGPQLNVGNLVGYFTLDTSDLERARTSVTGGLGDIRTQGTRAAAGAGAAIGAALTGAVVDAARDIGRAGERAGDQFGSGVADGTRAAVTAVDRLRAQAVIAGDKATAAMARYQQAVTDAAAGNASAARDARRFGAEATIAAADAQRAMETFETAARDAGAGAAQAGEDAKKSFGGLGEAAKGALAGLGLGTVLAKAMDADDATRKLQGQLRLTADEAGRFGKDAGALYSGNFADSLDEANDAIRSVVQNIDGMRTASDADLQSITGQVTSLASTFDQDLGGVTIAVGQMMKTGMAKNAQEALDLITAGFQAGDDKAGDFLDTLNEYPVQFQKAGLDGKAALGLITQGLQGGARDSDLVADSIKEIGVNLLDTGSNAATGLQMLGLNAQEVMGKYKLGGKDATEALQSIFDRVHELGGATQNMGALANIASSQIEDMGSSFDKLDTRTVADSLGDVAGRAQELTNTVGGSASGAISSFWKSLQTTATTIGQQLLPQLTPLLPALQDVAGAASALVGGFTSLPEPLKNAGLALGAILLLKGPLIGMFGQVQARAAAMAVSLAASNGIAGAAGGALGGVSRLAGFLGGPWGVAIGLGVTALATFASGNHDSEEAVAANKGRIDALAGTLDTITGKLTTASAVKIGQDWIAAGTAEQFDKVKGGAAAAATSIVQGGDAIASVRHQLLEGAGGWDEYAKHANISRQLINEFSRNATTAGMSSQSLVEAVLAGGPAYDALATKIAAANQASGVGATNMGDVKDNLRDVVAALDPAVAGLSTYNAQVTSSGQASQIAADSIKLQADATRSAKDAEAARATGMVTTMQTQDALVTAEDEHAAALKRTAEAGKSLSQWVTEQQADYSASYKATMDVQGAQLQLATAIQAVKDAPTKDFAAMQKSIDGVAASTSKASTETSAFAIEIDKLTGRNVPLQDATKALNDQVRNLATTFGTNTAATAAAARGLVDLSGNIDTTTDAGSKLYDSVTSYSDAYNTSVTAAMDAAGAHATVAQKTKAAGDAADVAYQKFITQATGLGLSDTQARALATNMGILESKKLTPKTLHLDAQDKASDQVDALDKKVQGLQDKEIQLKVHAVGMINDAAGNATMTLNSDGSFRTGNNQTGMKDGGPVIGPGNGTSDSITRKLSHGEFVVNALGTARNRKAIEYANNGGIIPGFATGGYVNYQMSERDDSAGAFANVAGILANAQSSADSNNAAVDAAAKAAAEAIPQASTAGVEQWRALATRVFQEKGVPLQYVQTLLNQMAHESSGNPAAINLTDSNAQAGHPSVGLLQFIPSTFAANADPGHGSNIYDPESQFRAFVNYINNNYGGLASFTAKQNADGWGPYASGGLVQAPGSSRSDSGLARVSNGEFVVSQLGTARNRKAIEYANRGGIIPGFADGGYVTGGQLAGNAPASYGTRRSAVNEGIGGLYAEVGAAQDAVAAFAQQQKEAWAAVVQARHDQATASKAEAKAAADRTKAAEQQFKAAKLQKEAAAANAHNGTAALQAAARNLHTQQVAAKQYDKVADALQSAMGKLQNLKDDRAQLQGSIAGSVSGFDGGITGHAEQRTTGAQVQAGLTYDLKKIAAFRNDLKAAAAKGIDPQLLAEVAGKGVEGGAVTLHALATSSKAQIAGINATQRQILAMSNSAGNLVAGQQFDPLIRSQQKLVNSMAGTLAGLDRILQVNGRLTAAAVAAAVSRLHVTVDAQGLSIAVAAGNKLQAKRG